MFPFQVVQRVTGKSLKVYGASAQRRWSVTWHVPYSKYGLSHFSECGLTRVSCQLRSAPWTNRHFQSTIQSRTRASFFYGQLPLDLPVVSIVLLQTKLTFSAGDAEVFHGFSCLFNGQRAFCEQKMGTEVKSWQYWWIEHHPIWWSPQVLVLGMQS